MKKYQIEIYRLDVSSNTFSRIDVLENYKNLQYTNVHNDIGSCQFQLSVYDPKATKSNLIRYSNFIAVRRWGDYVWFGPIVDLPDLAYSNAGGDITIKANTPLFSLKETYTAPIQNYTEQDTSAIAWDLINTQQSKTNGNLGIIQGNLAVAPSKAAKYENTSNADAILELSERLGGFDFTFTPVLDANGLITQIRFNTIYPRVATYRRDLAPFELGVNMRNIQLATAKPIYNQGLVRGQGTGENVPTSEQSFGSSQIGYTRREVILNLKDTSNPELLSAYLNNFLEQSSSENYRIMVTLHADMHPKLGTYYLGDVVKIKADLGAPDLLLHFGDALGRITEIDVTVDDQETEYVTPKLTII
jgi:hypothetical protein